MYFCSIGHVTFDLIDQQKQTGGSVLFNSFLAQNLSHKPIVVTSSSGDFPYAEYNNIEWSVQFAAKTTMFQHEYVDEKRNSKVLQRADVIVNKSVPKFLKDTNLVMVAPVLDEVTPDIFETFSTEWLALTPQGWFRKIGDDGEVLFTESKFRSLPKKIKLIVVSRDDLQNDPSSWDWIRESAEVAVQTMGSEGYLLCSGGVEKKYAPVEVFNEVNPTGCGDIFATATLLALYNEIDPIQACAWAGHAAGLSSKQHGMRESVQVAARFLKSKLTR